MTRPKFFETPAEFRQWLEENHEQETGLWVGYYKKGTGKPGITWPESVDEALCFGWIDGVRQSIDAERYKIRFTPRRPGSTWSAVNIRRVNELIALGRMAPAGLSAFEKRTEKRSRNYSYEQKAVKLATEYENQIKANPAAWAFFEKLAPSYKKASIHWVRSAKKAETRQRRLEILIRACAAGEKIPPLQVSKKSKKGTKT